ncbi:peroxisome 1-like proliferator-activated receptor gamma coactivator-related protein, partial [Mytilus galloprovincialis]
RDQFQGQDVFQEILTQVILLTQGQDQGHQITDDIYFINRTSRSRSREKRRQRRQKEREERKQQQIEERRIIYVGKVPNDYTRKKLHTRFQRFGEIEEVSLHFREHGDNYGFVTFLYTCDAYAAIE